MKLLVVDGSFTKPGIHSEVGARLIHYARQRRFQVQVINYPATYIDGGSYRGSVNTGIAELRRHLHTQIVRNEPYMLAGYSQGATIVGDYLRAPNSHRGLLRGVAQIADPHRQRGTGHLIGHTTGGDGVSGPKPIPRLRKERILEVVNRGDIICDAPADSFARYIADFTEFTSTEPHEWEAWAHNILNQFTGAKRVQMIGKHPAALVNYPRRLAQLQQGLTSYLSTGHTRAYVSKGYINQTVDRLASWR